MGLVAIVSASALSSVGWVLEGQAVARLSPLSVVCVSSLLAGVFLIVMALVWGSLSFREALRFVTPLFVVFSLLRSAVLSMIFGYCLTLTSSTKIMFLTKIEPYVVLLIQILFHGYRTTSAHLVLLAVHVVGAVLLSTGGSFHLSLDTVGDFLIFVGVVGNAALYAPAQRFSRDMGVFYSNGLSQLLGGIALVPFVWWFSRESFGVSETHIVGWLYLLSTVIVFYVASTSLSFFSLKELPAWLASALRCVGPLIAAPIAWVVFDQPLTPSQTLGALVVIATSMWMVVLEKRGR